MCQKSNIIHDGNIDSSWKVSRFFKFFNNSCNVRNSPLHFVADNEHKSHVFSKVHENHNQAIEQIFLHYIKSWINIVTVEQAVAAGKCIYAHKGKADECNQEDFTWDVCSFIISDWVNFKNFTEWFELCIKKINFVESNDCSHTNCFYNNQKEAGWNICGYT